MASDSNSFLQAMNIRKRRGAHFLATAWRHATPGARAHTHTHTHNTYTHTTPTHWNSDRLADPANMDTRVHWVTHREWDALCLHGSTPNPTTPRQKS